jgi:hypothetical protein
MQGDEDLGAPTVDAAEELATLRTRNAALEASLREVQENGDRRAIASELRSEAVRRGMVDLDGLKLIEAGGVSIDAEGTVHGVAAVMTKLRREKPWLFGASSSSSLAGVPSAAPARTKLATEMTLQEWRVARAELVRRR